jgi:predicted dehydrogenase
MSRLGIGLIGVGRHGARYAHHILRDFPGLRLAGIWRRDLEAGRLQGEEWGCPVFADYRDLLVARDVDAVVVVVPPTLHRAILGEAAMAGKPVLLEKPAAPSFEDGVAILAAVRRHDLPVMVAQTLRFNGVVAAVAAARERIGRIHAGRLSQRFEPSRPGWIDDPAVAGGGVILHTGVHSFDLLRHLTGMEVETVHCETATVGTARTEDNFVASIRLSGDGALASVAGSRATASRTGPIELAGARGTIVADHVLNTAAIVRGTSLEPLPVPDPVPTVRATIAAFAGALASGRPMPIPLDEGLAAIAVVSACYRSAVAAAPVAVPRFVPAG